MSPRPAAVPPGLRPSTGTVRLLAAASLAVLAGLVATGPQLRARLTGSEYVLRVAVVDPVDPFRGSYVALDYPDLGRPADLPTDPGTSRYVRLVRAGGVWRGAGWSATRPASGPYLACHPTAWRAECGIDSWFVPAARARALERRVVAGTARATVRVDARGHAAVVGLS